MKKMYLFYEGGHPDLKQMKREQLWVTLITGLHSDERDDISLMNFYEKYLIHIIV